MAEAAVLTPLGWVVSPLTKLLFDRAHKLLGTSIDERRKILEATVLPRLSLAIEKAEKSDNKDKLVHWLERLNDAYYKAEEAIDLFEYELLEKKVMDHRNTLMQKMKSKAARLISSSGSEIKLKGRIDKLIEIAKEANDFRDLLEEQENGTTSNPDRETISQPFGKVFGREKDKEKIAGLLKEEPLISEPGPSTTPPIPIIAIMGRSGIGKTTLAKYVYQYMEEQGYFDLLLWVHVPRKFKTADVVKNILQNIQAKDGSLHVGNYDPSVSLEVLVAQTKRMLDSKKFLIILDDFWCDTDDDIEQWENFICFLSNGLRGSKILLTTQYITAVKHASLAGITEIKTYTLQELEQGHFLDLFMHHAWSSDCFMQREEFETIGCQIAAKLKGDPGAAKIVGRQLRNNPNLRYWERTAQKDWLGDNMKARIWSYQQLPVHLQRCFAFFSLFPKGLRFSGWHIIKVWMAEGFIKPIDTEERMEDMAENSLNELTSRFFLEQDANDGDGTYYRLHDLLHDLAERVQGDNFLRIEYTNAKDVPEYLRKKLSRSENIRHIYLPACMMNILKDNICGMKNLCTLLCVESNCIVPEKVLQDILESSKKLKVLCLSNCVEDLPDCIGQLKHLRYLDLPSSRPFKKLPDSICKLYLLQTLFVPSCETLPKKFCRLVSLRHIAVKEDAMSHVSYIGRLTSLQGLEEFTVVKKHGHELHQLEKLNQIRGAMVIKGLENVTSIDDAVKANMPSKKHLEALGLEWNSDERVVDDFGLLNALKPHPNYIRFLSICSFGGSRFPNWIIGQNSLKHLTTLLLMRCTRIKELPLLPPNLTKLLLNHIPHLSYFSENDLLMKEERKEFMLEALKQVGAYMKSRYMLQLPRSVESVVMRFLMFMKEKSEAPVCIPLALKIDSRYEYYYEGDLLIAWEVYMSSHLEAMVNENVESKLVLPSSLASLHIEECSITNDALSTCIQSLLSLTELKLVEIHTLTSLPPEEALCALKNLRSLYIEACYLLSSLGGIRVLTSIRELTMAHCFNWDSSNAQLPSSLEILKVQECVYADATVNELLYMLNEHRRERVLHVGHLSGLEQLAIMGWEGRLEGLDSLTSLWWLALIGYPGFDLLPSINKFSTRIKGVFVDNPLRLKKVLSDETISSIEYLIIFYFEGDPIDDEVSQFLTSVKHLHLQNCNNTHPPLNLMYLTSLRTMILDNCPNLHEMILPENIRVLEIKDCPTLLENFNNADFCRISFHEGTATVTFPTKAQFAEAGPSGTVNEGCCW